MEAVRGVCLVELKNRMIHWSAGMRKDNPEKKNQESCKKAYERPTLERRERLVEVTEGLQPIGGATP